jgi:hypothetical protein
LGASYYPANVIPTISKVKQAIKTNQLRQIPVKPQPNSIPVSGSTAVFPVPGEFKNTPPTQQQTSSYANAAAGSAKSKSKSAKSDTSLPSAIVDSKTTSTMQQTTTTSVKTSQPAKDTVPLSSFLELARQSKQQAEEIKQLHVAIAALRQLLVKTEETLAKMSSKVQELSRKSSDISTATESEAKSLQQSQRAQQLIDNVTAENFAQTRTQNPDLFPDDEESGLPAEIQAQSGADRVKAAILGLSELKSVPAETSKQKQSNAKPPQEDKKENGKKGKRRGGK